MRAAVYLLKILAFLLLGYSMLWGALALWFRLPDMPALKLAVIAVFLVPGVFASIHLFNGKTWRSILVYIAGFVLLMVWWNSLTPPTADDWAPEVARQVTGTISDDELTLEGVRAFEWRTQDDFTEVWSNRTYDLSRLETLDLFLSYWGDPRMAHFILSFGFGDDTYLAWSVEVRRLTTGTYSPLADFFKENPLVIVAAEEFDVVGMRSNIRQDDVHIFRIKANPDNLRRLLEGYVADANSLAAQPEWYNSIFTNCTTVVFKTMAALGLNAPFDWRIIVNGYLPDYLYEHGVLNTEYSVEELRQLGRIAERAESEGLTAGYSKAIRKGVPSP